VGSVRSCCLRLSAGVQSLPPPGTRSAPSRVIVSKWYQRPSTRWLIAQLTAAGPPGCIRASAVWEFHCKSDMNQFSIVIAKKGSPRSHLNRLLKPSSCSLSFFGVALELLPFFGDTKDFFDLFKALSGLFEPISFRRYGGILIYMCRPRQN
jgi:hypothetical protein